MLLSLIVASYIYVLPIIVIFFEGEACGKMCRVPYLKGGFTVTGLPEGITFKKPSQYGIKQISNIMKNAQNIHFKIIESPQVEKVLTENRKYSDQERECYRSVLKKVVFEEAKVSMCLIRNKLIEECDLVVTDVDLTKSELDLLTGKLKNFFKPDAFATLIANCKSSRTHEGYILPVYTDSDEPYWLFYYPGAAEGIESLSTEDKIWGYWLDKTSSELTYKLIKTQKTNIIGLNLICYQDKELGTLRLKTKIFTSQISIPFGFHTSVLECLAKQDFL